MLFTENTDGIFEDKRQKGRTGQFTNKQEAPTKDESGRPKHPLAKDRELDRCG